eukprot:jgi/Mesvir1/17225/Mv07639-RA.1
MSGPTKFARSGNFVMRPSVLLLGLFVVSLTPAAWAQQGRSFTVGNTTVEFIGRSGQFRVCGSLNCSGDNWLQIKMNKLEEVSSSGANVNNKVSSFASQDYTWSEPTLVEVPTTAGPVNATFVQFSATLRVGSNSPSALTAGFTFKTWLFHDLGLASNGEESVLVEKGALKFTTEVTGWRFQAHGNKLTFSVDVKSGKDGDQPTDVGKVKQTPATNAGSAKQTRYELGKGVNLRAPEKALVDGEELEDIAASYAASGNSYIFVWTFPSFNDTLVFDPVISFAEEESSPSPPPPIVPSPPPPLASSPPPSTSPSPPPAHSPAPPPLDDHEDDEQEERNQTLRVNARRCEFVGRSGQLRLCARDDCGRGDWLQLRMNKLVEVVAAGQETGNAVPAFASQAFTWSNPALVQVPTTTPGSSVAATFVTFNATLRVGSNRPGAPRAGFTVDTWLFHDAAVVYNGNSTETVAVPKGTLKFTVRITSWPFLNATNRLQFSTEVTSGRTNATDGGLRRSNVTNAGSSRQTRVEVGSGVYLRAPTRAVVDGALANVTDGVTESPMGTGMTGGLVTWTFPYFNGSLLFDPVISFAEDEAASPPPPPALSASPPPKSSSPPPLKSSPPPTNSSPPPPASANDRTFAVAGTTVEFVGRSGQVRVCASPGCTGTTWLQIKMNRLQERDANGTATSNKVTSFASQDFTWSLPELVQVGEPPNVVNATRVVYSAMLKVGSNSPSAPEAGFAFGTWLYHEDGYVKNGNETVFVPKGALKFTALFTDWPFAARGSWLQFGLTVKSGREDADPTLSQVASQGGTAEQVEYQMGTGIYLRMPIQAAVDGNLVDVDTDLTATTSGYELDWLFPYFDDGLLYDPVISFTSAAGSPAPPPPSSSAKDLVLPGMLCWLAGMVALMLW